MTETLDQWSKENSAELQRLCKYLKEIAEIRLKSDEGKIRLKDQYQSSALTGLPKKYIKPTGRDNLELIIVEGDSAAGSIRNTRCAKRQGIFPIRGKIPNAFTTNKIKFLSNEEIAGIITIIGGGYGKSFDITKVKWLRVLLAADSDSDGQHIRALMLRFFILYLPELITAGKVFSAVPPLYGLKIGKKQTYFIEKMDFVRYNQREFSKNNQISTLNNKSMTV
jgi:DNA gyrase subunit B